jgi:ankyrin repeat protein
MKYIKLFEDFKVEDIPQSEPQFTQWMMKNAPKAVYNPQEWFEEEMAKPEPDWAFIGFIIKELGLANRLSIAKGAKEELELDNTKNWVDSLTLLHWATMEGHTELAKGLIDAGADVNAKDSAKQTPLHWAIQRNTIELAKMLIDAGADVNAESNWESTPLHWVAMEGYTELAKMLIEAGADVNAEEKWGRTPLHLAARNGNAELARVLIEAGADVNAEDEDERTPWDKAGDSMRQALPQLNPNP